MSGACYCGRCSGCRAAWEAGEREADQRDGTPAPTSVEEPWAWNHFGPEPGDVEDEDDAW